MLISLDDRLGERYEVSRTVYSKISCIW